MDKGLLCSQTPLYCQWDIGTPSIHLYLGDGYSQISLFFSSPTDKRNASLDPISNTRTCPTNSEGELEVVLVVFFTSWT